MQTRWNRYMFYAFFIAANMYAAQGPNQVTGVVTNTLDTFHETWIMVFSPDGLKCYISNYNVGTVDVIDVATNTVTATVAGQYGTPTGLALSNDGTQLYIADYDASMVWIVDTTADPIIINGSVGTTDAETLFFSNPNSLQMTPDGTTMYVNNNNDPSNIVVIDTNPQSGNYNNIVTQVTGTSFTNSQLMAITPDGAYLYVTDDSDYFVAIIDTQSNAQVGTVDDTNYPFNTPYAIAITPDGLKAYVANEYGSVNNTGSVAIIDLDSSSETYNKVIGLVDDPDQTMAYPWYLSILPSGETVYVVNYGDVNDNEGSVSMVDVATNRVTGLITDLNPITIYYPDAMGITPDGSKLYISNYGEQVSVVGFGILPPRNLAGTSMKNSFLTQINLINVISFDPPLQGEVPIAYNVYTDADLRQRIKTITNQSTLPVEGTFVYLDPLLQYNTTYTYYITSIDRYGNESGPATISITTLPR